MQPLRYSINVTLDGCCDHLAGVPDPELHQYAADILGAADTLLFGRVVYGMMEEAWRPVAESITQRGVRPPGVQPWMEPFALTIDRTKKYVVSSTLDHVDWNAELLRGDLGTAVRQLKQEDGRGIYTGGLQLPLALAELGLIDEYEFIIHPRIVGHGPTLFAGLSKYIDLQPVGRREFTSGAVALKFVPKG
jgi:dihydrofolate reductase